jgi:hypothetical protein
MGYRPSNPYLYMNVYVAVNHPGKVFNGHSHATREEADVEYKSWHTRGYVTKRVGVFRWSFDSFTDMTPTKSQMLGENVIPMNLAKKPRR